MVDFAAFKNGVLSALPGLATDTLGHLPAQLKGDVAGFLEVSRSMAERWAGMVKRGEIRPDEFVQLMEDLPDLASIVAFTDAGIAQAAVQRFRDGLINLIVDTALDTLVPI